MIKLDSKSAELVNYFKNNRKIVSFTIDETKSDDKSLVFIIFFKDESLNDKSIKDLIPTMLENRFLDFCVREDFITKKRVSPFNIGTETKFRFSVPTVNGSCDAVLTVFENLKNFIEQN